MSRPGFGHDDWGGRTDTGDLIQPGDRVGERGKLSQVSNPAAANHAALRWV
jgi:hypothetical protein